MLKQALNEGVLSFMINFQNLKSLMKMKEIL